jgi:hypothetical protein
VPNLVVVLGGAGGVVDFYNFAGSVHLIADLAGYFSPTSAADYTAVSPCRLFDTRSGAGACSGAAPVTAAPVGSGGTLSAQVTGAAGIPVNATAVVLNVTAVGATADTYVTVFPQGAARPVSSNLNVHNANPVPNLVIVPIGAGGKVDLYNFHGNVNLIADVAGYFSPTPASGYTATGPCRVFDTRSGVGSCAGGGTVTKAPIGLDGTLSVKVTDLAGVPDTATAVVLNVTAVGATSQTVLTVFPHGTALPVVSNLNVNSAGAVPNLVIVPVGAGGMVDFHNLKGNVNVIADIAGYYAP